MCDINKDGAPRESEREEKPPEHSSLRVYNIIIGYIAKLRSSPRFTIIMLAFLSICVGLVSLLLGATGTESALFRLYVKSPIIMLLNLLPPILLVLLLYFAIGRAWIAFSIPSFIILLLSVVEFYKLQVRNDPLYASDLLYFREVGNVISGYTFSMHWKVYLAIAAFIIGLLFCATMLRYKIRKLSLRTAACVSLVAISVLMYRCVYSDITLYDNTAIEITGTQWSATRNYISKGFLYPFIHSISTTMPVTPYWYLEDVALSAFESYVTTDIPWDKKVNVIGLMLESYVDFSSFDKLDFILDVFGPLHKLQDESVTGILVSNTFGGGTIDTERLFLTGNTRLSTFNSPTNSFVHYLRSQGYYTEGLHTGDSWFYDRLSVNKYLGFDRFRFLDDFQNSTRWDSFFFDTTLDMYMERDKSIPYFSFCLSYQNHGAYDATMTDYPHLINKGSMSEETFNVLNNYLFGIYDTTIRLDAFVDELRDDTSPVVLLIFGDHMPSLGTNNSVYTELGINIERSTEEGFYNYYSTPYLIWANDAAKAVLDNEFTGVSERLSPCFLMGELFRQCSWEGDAYMQALRDLMPVINVISPILGLFTEYDVLTSELTQETRELYMKLRMMEQYRLTHFISY